MMDSANEEDIRDIERDLVKRTHFSDDFTPEGKGTSPARERKPAPKMLLLRHFVLTVLTISIIAVTLVSGLSPIRVPRSPTVEDQKKFLEIIDSTGAEPSSLHDSLRKHLGNYKVDAYNEAKLALASEAEQNGDTASNLVNLLKRQETGTTNGTVDTPPGVTTETTQTTQTATTLETTSITSSFITTETQPPVDPTTSPSATQQTTPSTTPSITPGASPSTTTSGPTSTNSPTVKTSDGVPPSPTTSSSVAPTDGNPTKGMYTRTHWVTVRSFFGPTSLHPVSPILAPYANSTCLNSPTANYTSPFWGAHVTDSGILNSTVLLSLCSDARPPIAFPVDASSRSLDFSRSPSAVSTTVASANSRSPNSNPLSIPVASSSRSNFGASGPKASIAMSQLSMPARTTSTALSSILSSAISLSINPVNASLGALEANPPPMISYTLSPANIGSDDSLWEFSSMLSLPSSSKASDSRHFSEVSASTSLTSSNSTSLEVFVTTGPVMAANATLSSYISSHQAPVVTQEAVTMSRPDSFNNTSLSGGPNLNTSVGGSSFVNPAGSSVVSNPKATISSQIKSNNITAPSITSPPNKSSSAKTRQSVTSLEIFTTTSSNGKIATITRTTVVQADQADATSAGGGSKTSSASIGLQTNAATRTTGGMGVIMACMLTVGGYLTMSL